MSSSASPLPNQWPTCALAGVGVTLAGCLSCRRSAQIARLLAFINTPPIGVASAIAAASGRSVGIPPVFDDGQPTARASTPPPHYFGMQTIPSCRFRRWDMPRCPAARQPGCATPCDGRRTLRARQLRFPRCTGRSLTSPGCARSDSGPQGRDHLDRLDGPVRSRHLEIRPGGESTWRQYRSASLRRQPQRRVERLQGSRRRGNCLEASEHPVLSFSLNVTNSVFLPPGCSTNGCCRLPKARLHQMNQHAQMYAMVAFQGGYGFWDTVAPPPTWAIPTSSPSPPTAWVSSRTSLLPISATSMLMMPPGVIPSMSPRP